MKTKKRIALFIAALALTATVALSAVAFAVCGSDTVSIAGSTSMKNVMEALADAYNEKTGNQIDLNFNGSGEGIKAAQDGSVDFGLASRDLKDTETGVDQVTIAVDVIALIVATSNSVTNVTSQEVFSLYSEGTAIQTSITTPVIREDGSGTRSAFEEIIKGIPSDGTEEVALEKVDLLSGMTETTSTGTMIETVSSNASAIGFASYSEAKAAEDQDQVKILQFESVTPTTESIGDGSYTLARNFNLILPDGGYAALSDAAKDFYDFIASEEGIAVITAENLVTVDIPSGDAE